MAYPVRRKLQIAPIPKPLAGAFGDAASLLVQLDEAQASAMGAVTAETTDAFNQIVTAANEVRDRLAQGGDLVLLEREVAERIADFAHFARTGTVRPVPGRRPPWLLLGIGAAVLGGIWWWSRNQRRAAGPMGDVIAGFSEDCGCSGTDED